MGHKDCLIYFYTTLVVYGSIGYAQKVQNSKISRKMCFEVYTIQAEKWVAHSYKYRSQWK